MIGYNLPADTKTGQFRPIAVQLTPEAKKALSERSHSRARRLLRPLVRPAAVLLSCLPFWRLRPKRRRKSRRSIEHPRRPRPSPLRPRRIGAEGRNGVGQGHRHPARPQQRICSTALIWSASVYYHDGFLSDFPDEKPDADPARRIVREHRERTLNAEQLAYVRRRPAPVLVRERLGADAPRPSSSSRFPMSGPPPEPPPSKRKRSGRGGPGRARTTTPRSTCSPMRERPYVRYTRRRRARG